jgi:hypothetical protein
MIRLKMLARSAHSVGGEGREAEIDGGYLVGKSASQNG